MVYRKTNNDAEVPATALALRVIADRTEQVKKSPKTGANLGQQADSMILNEQG